MLVNHCNSKSTDRFVLRSVRQSAASFLTTGEKTCGARIMGGTAPVRPQTARRRPIFSILALLNFLLVTWLPAARAQNHRPSSPAYGQKGLVSVRELQIPAKARTIFARGVEDLTRGDAAGSLIQFKRAVHEFPSFYEAYYNEGIAEIQLHQTDEALQSFQKAIDIRGGRYARAYFGYGLVLAQLGRSEEAESLVRRGLEEDSSLSDGYAILSILLFNRNRLEEAEEAAHKALRMPNPSTRNALITLAHVHLKKGQYQAAAQDLEGYLKAARASPCKDDEEYNQSIRKMLGEIQGKIVAQNAFGPS
jgi:tetratricopeptide (TPR) repeat protein